MNAYHKWINRQTGVKDHALLNDIEQIMRELWGDKLDRLTPAEFSACVQKAEKIAVLADFFRREGR